MQYVVTCYAHDKAASRPDLLQVAERVLGVTGGALQRARTGPRGVLCSASRLVSEALGLQSAHIWTNHIVQRS